MKPLQGPESHPRALQPQIRSSKGTSCGHTCPRVASPGAHPVAGQVGVVGVLEGLQGAGTGRITGSPQLAQQVVEHQPLPAQVVRAPLERSGARLCLHTRAHPFQIPLRQGIGGLVACQPGLAPVRSHQGRVAWHGALMCLLSWAGLLQVPPGQHCMATGTWDLLSWAGLVFRGEERGGVTARAGMLRSLCMRQPCIVHHA